MRRYLAFAVVGLAVLGLALAGGRLTLPETLARSSGSPVGVPGLETMFSGGWLLYGEEPSGTVEVLLALNGGGTTVINATPTPAELFNTTGIGSWKPVGPREVTASFMCFVRDYLMNLRVYERAVFSMTLSDDGNMLEGTAVIYIYPPGQNPLDPAVEPIVTVPDLPVWAYRIPPE
ncbi:MAG: hypothetical protein JXA90_02380 [Planctomycetes bacterium]|nr:hypothetical protein [Planctomycetota bacterium]